MRIFRNVPFRRFMKEHGLKPDQLCAAARELSSGLIHASLGGGVYKQRIARRGAGKSGGFRTIVCFRSGEAAFFILGFAKNEIDSIDLHELKALKDLAKELFSYGESELKATIQNGTLEEVHCKDTTP